MEQTELIQISLEKYRAVVNELAFLFKDENMKRFFLDMSLRYENIFSTTTAAKMHHHAFKGGLLVHTLDLLESFRALLITGLYDDLCVDYVSIAVLYHDIAKIFEYKELEDGTFDKTQYLVLIGHHYGSTHMLQNDMNNNIYSINQEDQMQIMHCILAHHGNKEWGAVQLPQTKEAYMVHLLDMLSAKCSNSGDSK